MPVIYGYHDYCRPQLKFYGGNDDGETLFLGFENELDSNQSGVTCTSYYDKLSIINHSIEVLNSETYLYYMRDGSLRNGLEMISQPATLDYHLSIKDKYQQILNHAYLKKMRADNRQTCGLHIHFNKSYFHDNEDLYTVNLLYLVEKFWKQLVLFSRRNYRSLKRWADKYDKAPEEIIKLKKQGAFFSRYQAVNLTNKHTIEFRMFRGTMDAEILSATLKLTENLIKRAKTKDIISLQRLTFEDLLTDDSMKNYYKKCTTKAKIKRAEEQLSGVQILVS